MRKAVFLIQTRDRKGLLAEISAFFYSHNYNILLCRQYTDVREDKYFMRIIIDLCEQTTRKQMEEDFARLAAKFELHYSIYYDDVPQNVAIMVSKTSHCLYDLLMHAEEGDLDCRIPLIIATTPIWRASRTGSGSPSTAARSARRGKPRRRSVCSTC